VLVQPFFTLFIFGKVLTSMGYVGGGYTAICCRNRALNGFSSAAEHHDALIMDFSWTREIEDRFARADCRSRWWAVEKILFGASAGWSPRW